MLRIKEADILRLEDKFRAHGNMYVFFGRLIPGVRSIVSIPAGLSEMPFARFMVLTTVGSAIWNSLLIGIGWGLGSQYEKVAPVVGPISRVVLVAVIAGTLYWIIKTAMSHRKSGPTPEA
jgi:membrane protein DedA with SNARE-associated domain